MHSGFEWTGAVGGDCSLISSSLEGLRGDGRGIKAGGERHKRLLWRFNPLSLSHNASNGGQFLSLKANESSRFPLLTPWQKNQTNKQTSIELYVKEREGGWQLEST